MHDNIVSLKSKIYLFRVTYKRQRNILLEYEDICKKYGYKLKCSYGGIRPIKKKNLNANAGLFNFQSIVITPEWIYQLIFNEDTELVRNALLGTIGHEISHKLGNIKGIKKFELWVNEVHCDFKSATITLNNDREKLIQGIRFKTEFKAKTNPNILTKQSGDHPSWEQRLDYISNYNYDEKLIRRIAKDTKCSDENRIQKVINQFEPIILE